MSMGMNLDFGPLCYTAGALYSCGPGQILGVPGAVISLTVALVQGVAAAVFSCMGEEDKAKEYKESAVFSLMWAAGFTLGIIPIFGGMIAYRILK